MTEKDNFNLASFQRAQREMVQKNTNKWDTVYGDYIRSSGKLKNYSLEEIDRIINSTGLIEQQKLSRNYFQKDGFYKRIIIKYATLLTYGALLTPNPAFGKKLSTPHIQKRYYAALDYIDKNITKELLTRWSMRALVDGAYYGVVRKLDTKDFVMIDLPSSFCRSRFKDVYGNDLVEFDLSYFDKITDNSTKKQVLLAYPKEIAKAYRAYSKNKGDQWIFIPSELGFCFSFTEDCRPPFLSTIPATIQYDQAIDTERERDLEEIRKIIVQKVPHLADGQLLFEPEEAAEMHAGSVDMMKGNKNVSVLTTYTDVDAILSHTGADNSSTTLEKMMQNIYAEAGTSSQTFSPTNSQSVKLSNTNDMMFMMSITYKYSRFVTYITNKLFSNSNITFTYEILPVSYFNQSDYIADALKLAQSGYSFLLPSIGMGLSQKQLVNIKELENDVLNLGEVLKPLASSYTQSGDEAKEQEAKKKQEEGKKLEDKSDKTIQNDDSKNKQGGSLNE